MRGVLLVLVLSTLSCMVGCERASGSPPAPAPAVAPQPHELVASMERTACYGWCPIYKIAIYRDGVVEYMGDRFVLVRGHAIGHVSAAQLAQLDRMFDDAHVFDLADHYLTESFTDESTTHVFYQRGARAKQIDHYEGDETAPAALDKLEQGIDRLVGAQQWIGTPQQREQHEDELRAQALR